MEVGETVAHLPRHVRDLLLREPLAQVHDDGVQGTAIAVLNEHLYKIFDYQTINHSWFY